jgi:hypothetical protein
VSPTARQVTGDRGERAVIRHVACPRCNRTKQLAQLPRNFQCADLICKFCGFLAQVKTTTVAAQAAGPPNTILGAAWRPQHEQIIAGIYQSLYIVGLTKAGRLVRIDYVPAHILQATPTVFAPREPLSQQARRAGWQGFMLRIDRLPEIGIHQVYPDTAVPKPTPRRDQVEVPARVSRHPSLAIATKGLGPVRELFLTEGGVVYEAEGPDAWYLITDEGSMAGMLDEEDSDLLDKLVAVYRFADDASRSRYAAQRRWNPETPPSGGSRGRRSGFHGLPQKG